MDIESMRQNELGQYLSQLRELQDRKGMLLKEQGNISMKLNAIARRQNDVSRRMCRSLERAVVLSTRPGYIKYMQRPPENIEDIRSLVRSISEKEEAIQQVQNEIDLLTKHRKREDGKANTLDSFEQWFSKNGRPNVAGKGYVSEFKPSKQFLRHWGIGDDGQRMRDGAVQKKSKAISMITGRLI